MRQRLKQKIQKSFADFGGSFFPLFLSSQQNGSIKDHEYIKFFVWWQYAAISTIADSIAGLDRRLADSKDQAVRHEYSNYITAELLYNIVVFIKMTWTAYIRKITQNNKVLGLSILLPRNLTPIVSDTGILSWWKYKEGTKTMTLSTDEVMVFAEFNPHQRYPHIMRGYSPLQAIAMTVRQEKEIEEWNYSLLTHDVPPWTILTTDQALTPEQLQTIKSGREANHTGAKNVWKMAVLPFGIRPLNIQSSPKEMEFVAQQAWDRDKILAIYKVPKAILGIADGVNVGNVKAFNQIYASRCIEPLAKKIASIFNQQLFNWVGVFEFVRILPTDEEEIRNHYITGGITRNEYRQELWYKPVKWGDVFADGTEAEIQATQKELADFSPQVKSFAKNVDFKKIVKENIKRSEEWMQKRRTKKQQTNQDYESNLKIAFLKIFEKQKNDILKKIDEQKGYINKKGLDYELLMKYYALYYLFLRPQAETIIQEQGTRAMAELDLDTEKTFIQTDKIKKEIRQKIQSIAKSVDAVTDEKLAQVVEQALANHLWPTEIKQEISKVFDDLSTRRLDTIVRTEAIRFGTYAEQKAWEQSGVVGSKQRRTALDERRCEHCASMHGKKIGLQDNFFKQWSVMIGENGGKLKLDYENVIGSPLHPNCRCDMIPLLE